MEIFFNGHALLNDDLHLLHLHEELLELVHDKQNLEGLKMSMQVITVDLRASQQMNGFSHNYH